jgi:hypothetical protein
MRLVALVFLVWANACAAVENLGGRWEGLVEIPGQTLNLIGLGPSGKSWSGSIIVPGLGLKDALLSEIAVSDSAISFTISRLSNELIGKASVRGRLDRSGMLKGNFMQAGNSAPFRLQKRGPAQVELPRSNSPISFNFVGEWKGDYERFGYPRGVTLTLRNDGSAHAIAQLQVVGNRTTQVPVDLVQEENSLLTIESHDFAITFGGRLQKDRSEIRGFSPGSEAPLRLRHTT